MKAPAVIRLERGRFIFRLVLNLFPACNVIKIDSLSYCVLVMGEIFFCMIPA